MAAATGEKAKGGEKAEAPEATLAEQIAQMEARLQKQLDAGVQAAEERAAAAERRAEELERRLEEAKAGGEQGASGEIADLIRVLVARDEERANEAAKAGAQTFGDGESVASVMQQLQGATLADDPSDQRLEVPVTFRSRGANFCVVRKPRNRHVLPTGEQQITTGILLDFAPNGELTTDSVENVAWLKSRNSFNVEFFEVGNEPGRVPSPEQTFRIIAKATAELDDATLAALQELEEREHKREPVLQMLASSRATVQGLNDPED